MLKKTVALSGEPSQTWRNAPSSREDPRRCKPPAAPASRHLPIRKDWLAATQEQALEPDRPIIDPHHHLWDRPGNRYLFHDLMEDLTSGHNIRATVFLECREMYRAEGRPPELRSLGETQFVAGGFGDERAAGKIRRAARLRRDHRQCRLPHRQPRQGRVLRNSTSLLSGGRFRGIRQRRDPLARGPEPAGVHLGLGGGNFYLDRAWRRAACRGARAYRSILRSRHGCSTANWATSSTSPAPFPRPRSC